MINLYYSNIKDLNLKKGYNAVFNQRKAKINRFKFEKDKKLSCGVELLLIKSLKDIGIKDPIFKLDKNNKPYNQIIIKKENKPSNIKFNLFNIEDNTYKLAICSKYNVKKPIKVNVEELI